LVSLYKVISSKSIVEEFNKALNNTTKSPPPLSLSRGYASIEKP